MTRIGWMTKQVGRNEAIYKNILPGAGALHRPYLDNGGRGMRYRHSLTRNNGLLDSEVQS